MRKIAVLHVFLVSLLLAGCQTPYQPRGATGGYTDQKIDGNTYQVGFYGNGNTPRDRVFRFWVYRCAELTQQSGYDYFVLLGGAPHAGAKPERVVPAIGSLDDRTYEPAASSRGGAYTYTPGSTYTITTHSMSGYIRMYKGSPDPRLRFAFRARDVISDLGPEINGGEPSAKSSSGRSYDPTVLLAPPSDTASRSDGGVPRAAGGQGTSIDDLKDLLPAAPGK